MSRSGVNLAVTRDGGTYNKLQRPDDYVEALVSNSLPGEIAVPATSSAANSHKRKLEDADNSDAASDDEPESKRPKEEGAAESAPIKAKPISVDPRRIRRRVHDCGMQSMFPELDDDESSDDATVEALAYLRNVRSEASAIPTLLIAASGVTDNETDRSMYSNGRGDHRAVYRDGLWVGVDPDAARQSEDSWFEEPVDLDPREQSYKSILRRYERLRATLANADPKELTALRKANPTRYKILPLPVKRQAWLSTLDREFPTPARLAQIDEWNVFCALQYCAESLGRDKVISKEKSCWIWSLLALAGEKGTLDYYRAGRIRDLGHKAGQLSVLLRNGARPGPPGDNEHEDVEEWHADSEVTEGEDEAQDDDDDAPPPAKAIGAQVDGTEEKDADSDNSADMSMSEDEGEIRDDDAAESEDKTSGLQEARARLLAQLGDRLVQPSIPPSKAAGYRKDESNRNNFRTEHKEENADAKLTQPPTKTYASRAEAEWQRQKMREEALAKAKPTQDLAQTDAAVTAVTLADSTTSSAKDPEATSRGQATPGQENIFKHGQEESHQVGRIDLNTRVTIDMILTVVAECYGQRDLLRYRKEW